MFLPAGNLWGMSDTETDRLARRPTKIVYKVGIGPNDAKGYGLAVAVNVSLPLLDQELAARLVDAAHEVCPYSNATRGNIDISIMLS